MMNPLRRAIRGIVLWSLRDCAAPGASVPAADDVVRPGRPRVDVLSRSRGCSAVGCHRLMRARGLCKVHDVEKNPSLFKRCHVDNCYEVANAKGLCLRHYTRMRLNMARRKMEEKQ